MKIAVIGATGAVGREMVGELAASSLRDCELLAFASPRSEGESLRFGTRRLTVKAFSREAVKGCTYVLMSAGGEFSRTHAGDLVKDGATVIDNSSAWRMQDDVPLIVPEVNGQDLTSFRGGIVANPNCSTIQLVVALAPLAQAWGLARVDVATYQSVSGSGQRGIMELSRQVQAKLRFEESPPEVYPQSIAFNVLSGIGAFDPQGHCEEEIKMVQETRKILKNATLPVLATTARVPVFNCHSEAVSVELAQAVTRDEVLALWHNAAGIVYHEEGSTGASLPTPLGWVGKEQVAVCRLRLPYGQSRSTWLQFWNVADNLKKGAATNAVQIVEYLHKLKG